MIMLLCSTVLGSLLNRESTLAIIYLLTFYLVYSNHSLLGLLLKAMVVKSILFLLLAPLEIYVMGKANISELQFSGGQYYNIGVLLLVAILSEGVLSTLWKRIIVIVLCATIITSFSRGALLIMPFVLLAIVRFKINVFFFLIGLSAMLSLALEDTFYWEYWRLRLNLGSDGLNDFFSSSSRFEIIEVYWNNVDLYHFIFGYGIGGIKDFLIESTSGVLQFGSLHNLFFNTLGELGLLAFVLLMFRFLLKGFINRSRSVVLLIAFLLFGLTTGLELVNMSRNYSMDIFLLILLL